ncbi:glycosyltransferase [Caulobacter sp. BK020]|uniref:glycosyltransferase n=1 Tax=Caulobacter sp. BK020 TaxID=2512117 RepID=UPI0010D6DD39|nr:glycosyltransferase [Caulobacter sp. BK020]TCS10448.1 glycosyltransferase involved in cell wall biosynthesis [Caulobacter sp. BK020]
MSATDPGGLSILLTNITLASRSGTETVTRDLAFALLQAGHRPMVYSPRLGPVAEEIRRASIPVTDDILAIGETPDVIHGHHVVQTAVAATRYPDTPAIFVCHDFMAWHDHPPRLPNIRAYVSISEAFRTRMTVQGGIDPKLVEVIPNGVDTVRFRPGPPPPDKPRRALAFAKNHGHLEAIQAACAQRGIIVDAVGAAVDRLTDAPEALLPRYDLVFCSALTAIEAMAALRPVIVCDGRGLAGFATEERYAGWRRENFGLRTLSRPVTVEALLDEIDAYDAVGAVALGERVRREANLQAWAESYVSLYRRAIRSHGMAPLVGRDETARAVALHMQTWNPSLDVAGWPLEREALLADIARLETGLAPIEPGQRARAAAPLALALTGFHPPESWGAWSAQRSCSARFRLAPGQAFEQIDLELLAFATPARKPFRIACGLDGRPLGEVVLENDGVEQAVSTVRLTLPQRVEGGQHWMTFETDDCVTPKSAGVSLDRRPLGFGLLAIQLG